MTHLHRARVTSHGRTPRHEATLAGKAWGTSEETVKLLLSHGADPRAPGLKGKTPLDHHPWWGDRVAP